MSLAHDPSLARKLKGEHPARLSARHVASTRSTPGAARGAGERVSATRRAETQHLCENSTCVKNFIRERRYFIAQFWHMLRWVCVS